MSKHENDSSILPKMAMKEIPYAKQDAQNIVALVKDKGQITGYKLSDGKIVNKEEAIELARQGGILNVGISERKGNEYLKSIPDDLESNNLNSLPSIDINDSENHH